MAEPESKGTGIVQSCLPVAEGPLPVSGAPGPLAADSTLVLVPIRSFDDAKSRLADVLSAAERVALAMRMAGAAVRAARALPVWVVTDDDEVAAWATTVGAEALRVGRDGLNASVAAAVEAAASAGFGRVIVAHADLPLAADLGVVAGPGVAIAPDRHGDGSNVLSVPVGAGFEFAYGPGSFGRHRREAERCGLSVTVIDEPSLALDIDSVDDLLLLADQTTTVGFEIPAGRFKDSHGAGSGIGSPSDPGTGRSHGSA